MGSCFISNARRIRNFSLRHPIHCRAVPTSWSWLTSRSSTGQSRRRRRRSFRRHARTACSAAAPACGTMTSHRGSCNRSPCSSSSRSRGWAAVVTRRGLGRTSSISHHSNRSTQRARNLVDRQDRKQQVRCVFISSTHVGQHYHQTVVTEQSRLFCIHL